MRCTQESVGGVRLAGGAREAYEMEASLVQIVEKGRRRGD